MNIDPPQIESQEIPIINQESKKCTVAVDVAKVVDIQVDFPPLCDVVPSKAESLDIITTVKIRDAKVFENIALNGPPELTVFRSWPHSPSNIPDPSKFDYRGKLTPNCLPWGATIFDFYTVEESGDPSGTSKNGKIFSGSQLLEWSKANANGEDGLAKDEIEWARREEEPCVLEPPAHGLYVVEQEANIRARKEGWGTSLPRDADAIMNSVDPTDSVCVLSPFSPQLC